MSTINEKDLGGVIEEAVVQAKNFAKKHKKPGHRLGGDIVIRVSYEESGDELRADTARFKEFK